MSVEEPVLVIGFNRPDHLSQVLDRLREVGVKNIFAAIDGPRGPADDEAVRACRKLIADIDWATSVCTNFQQENLGCGRGVTAAMPIKRALQAVSSTI